MKTSVLIIAHNEEKYIGECIESLLNQTQKADDIILLLHNSSDRTLEIAQKYLISIIPFQGPKGPVSARIEGLNHVNGDIILCIDGDSFAKNNWIEVMSKTLANNNVLVGSWIKFDGSVYSAISNMFNKYFCVSHGKRATRWLWGASFAFWGKDKEKVRECFKKNIDLASKLGLSMSRSAEDYYLAILMVENGKIEVTNRTYVTAYEKNKSNIKTFLRALQNLKNGWKIKNSLKRCQVTEPLRKY